MAALGHVWEEAYFSRPTDCAACGKFVWGVTKKQQRGVKCSGCGQKCHKKCQDRAVKCSVVDLGAEGDKNPKADTSGGSGLEAGPIARPRKSAPAMPSVSVSCALLVALPSSYSDPSRTLDYTVRISLPHEQGDETAGHILLTKDSDNYAVVLDKPLVPQRFTFCDDGGKVILRLDNAAEAELRAREAEAAAAAAAADNGPQASMEAPSSSMASMSLGAMAPSASMPAPDEGLAADLSIAGMSTSSRQERRSPSPPPVEDCLDDLLIDPVDYTQYDLQMSADDMATVAAFLEPHARERFSLVPAVPHLPDNLMVMTIGQYVNPAHNKSAGTAWLLRDDWSSASGRDVEEIYRSLGAPIRRRPQSEKESAAGFEEHNRCFVGPETRATLMARLDAAFAATGSAATDTKVDLSLEELESLVGASALAAMQETFAAPIDKIKMRRVSPSMSGEDGSENGDVINFHLDKFAKTMGVALNDASEYDGSRLTFALPGSGSLAQPLRRAGTATVHDNGIAHGVTPITRGVRYGLFLLSHGDSNRPQLQQTVAS